MNIFRSPINCHIKEQLACLQFTLQEFEDNSERTLDLPPVLIQQLVLFTDDGITVLKEADSADRVVVNNAFVSQFLLCIVVKKLVYVYWV